MKVNQAQKGVKVNVVIRRKNFLFVPFIKPVG